jgi:hypothetical protein
VACPPEQFDYRKSCGCVMAIDSSLDRTFVFDSQLTSTERDLLTALAPTSRNGKHCDDMTAAEATGSRGLTEALRRLDLILARHGYQPDGTPLETGKRAGSWRSSLARPSAWWWVGVSPSGSSGST